MVIQQCVQQQYECTYPKHYHRTMVIQQCVQQQYEYTYRKYYHRTMYNSEISPGRASFLFKNCYM